jgi:hypothetical protein
MYGLHAVWFALWVGPEFLQLLVDLYVYVNVFRHRS